MAVIMHNEYKNAQPSYTPLPGTANDAEAMERAFKHLQFATIRLRNGTKKQIENIISEVVSYTRYPEHYNCFAFVFSGHGGPSKTIVSSDEQLVDYEKAIIEPLDPSKSIFIAGIPKLVFIDACRGGKKFFTKGGNTSIKVEKIEVSVPDNVFVAYSTMEGYMSYEEKGRGSIWMQRLAKEIMTSKKSIGDILVDVNKTMKKEGLQQPQYWNSTVGIILSGKYIPCRLSNRRKCHIPALSGL